MTKQQSDFEKLKIARKNMIEAEGKKATNELVWGSLDTSGTTIYDKAERLSEDIRLAQHELGVQNPSCGVKVGAEILAKVGMLMDEKEE